MCGESEFIMCSSLEKVASVILNYFLQTLRRDCKNVERVLATNLGPEVNLEGSRVLVLVFGNSIRTAEALVVSGIVPIRLSARYSDAVATTGSRMQRSEGSIAK